MQALLHCECCSPLLCCCSSLQLLLFVKEGTSGDLRVAVLEILQSKAGSEGSEEALAAQLEAAVEAARPAAATDGLEGALAIGGLAGRLVNIVVGVAALQLVKGVSGTVLQQVSFTVEQRLWLHVIAAVCCVSAWARAHTFIARDSRHHIEAVAAAATSRA